jgi:hypothetical protein
MVDGRLQPRGAASPSLSRAVGQRFTGDPSLAVTITTSEPANLNQQVHRTTVRWQIKQTPLTTTVDMPGRHPAISTRRIPRGRMSVDRDAVCLCGRRADDQSSAPHRPKRRVPYGAVVSDLDRRIPKSCVELYRK